MRIVPPHRLTQHKKFVPYGTHPNFCFAKTSFMLEPLGEITKAQLGLNWRADMKNKNIKIKSNYKYGGK